MRNRNKAFLSCALVVAVGLLATTGAMAQSLADSCNAGSYLVETSGPTYPSSCAPCTEITYTIDGGPDPTHSAAVVASAAGDCSDPTTSIIGGTNTEGFLPGAGDPTTGFGKFACHEEVGKTTGNHRSLTIQVAGIRTAAPKSVAIKDAQKLSSCEIMGLGEVEAAGSPAPVTETLTHEGCSVEFTLNSVTGAVISAQLTVGAPADCQFFDNDVTELELFIDGESLGPGQFGKGYLQSGNDSCTTRIIGGRVYTWGRPCP